MIVAYTFDNANTSGNKEAVIVPAVPTLTNKLIASEINNLKDKVNEIIEVANLTISPILFLELRLKFKGPNNTLATLQVGDVVHGFKEAGVVWSEAFYLGGSITDRANYAPISPFTFEPVLITATTAGANQTFSLTPGFTVASVLKSRGPLFKGTEWSQTGDILTIIVNLAIGNTLYIQST